MTRRIIVGLAIIALTLAGVAGATIAYFSDRVEVTGVTIAMGTADLELNYTTNNTDAGYDANSSDEIDLNLNITGLYPGYKDQGDVWLRNVSQSQISLRPYVQLFAQGNWNALKNKIQVKITDKGHDGTGTYSWGWQDLEWWNSQVHPISDADGIAPESDPNGTTYSHQYLIEVKVKSDAGDEIQGKSLTNIRWVITGEQVH